MYKKLLLSCLLLTTANGLFGFKFYSQFKQDQFVFENYFNEKKEAGVFVDIGAHDGIQISNSYFFEKDLNWKGICIEARPDIFQALKKNRSCICLNACVSDRSGEADFLLIKGPIQMWSGLLEKYDERHIKRIEEKMAIQGGTSEVIKVQCTPLIEILEKHNLYHIDYLSMDIEGGELEILKTIDYDKFDITVIDVENNHRDPEFRKFLESKGYTFIKRIHVDEIYYKQPKKKRNQA